MPLLPPITPEQRTAALEKAALVRKERAELKVRLKNGTLTLAAALAEADSSDVIARTRVAELLRSLPGVGKARAQAVMEEVGIAATRRAGKLTPRQRAALEEKFAPANA